MTAVGSAQTIFPLLASLLVVIAWQIPFLMYALAVPVAILVYLFFDETLADSSSRPDGEARSYHRRLVRQLRRPQLFALLVAYAGPAFLYFGFQAYVSVHIVRVIGGSPSLAGAVVAIFSIVYAGISTQAGRTTTRFGNRYRPLVGSNILMAAGLGIFAFAPSLPFSIAGAIVFGTGYGLTSSLYRSLLPELSPRDLRGGIVSSAETLSRFGATISPIILGLVIGGLEQSIGFDNAVRWSIFVIASVIALLGNSLDCGIS